MTKSIRKVTRIVVLASVVALIGALLAAPVGARDNPGKGADNSKVVELQILAINDFHGNINTFSSSFGGTGGAQNLATNIRNAEAGVRNSIVSLYLSLVSPSREFSFWSMALPARSRTLGPIVIR